MGKFIVCIPAMDTVPTEFAQSMTGLSLPNGTGVVWAVGSLVHDARNHLAREAIRCGAEYALWLDSDMVFTQDFLQRMEASLEESGADMISAMCVMRKEPHAYCQYEELDPPDEGSDKWHTKPLAEPPEGIREIAGCGFAGLLMKTSVLEDVIGMWGDPFDLIPGLGEDLSFCVRARMLGKKIVCDGRIRMGHLGTQLYGDVM